MSTKTLYEDHLPVLFEMKEQISLKSAVSFVQYMINISGTKEPRFRLITLIGERHNKEFDCGNSTSISIADYVTTYIDRDSKTMVLLEMDIEQYIDGNYPKSVPLNSILEKDDKYHSNMRYYDPRNLFLPIKDRYALYNTKLKLNHSDRELWDIYGKPFYEKWSKISGHALSEKSYGKEQKYFLTNIFYNSINKNFKEVYDILHSDNDSSKCIHKLRICWLKVTDWFIMSIMMNDSEENTAIAIMGDIHLSHIVDEILLTNGKLNDSRDATSGSCVNLFETIYMESLLNNSV